MIKIMQSKFRNGEPFYPCFTVLANQTWGGKADAALMKISAAIQNGMRNYQAQRDKYIKEYGSPDANGNYSMAGASKENIKEFTVCMEEADAVEIELPIDEPVKITKRKKTQLTPFQAAALTEIVEIIWPEDDGSELDKADK